MSAWTGGLPPSASERVARQRASGTAGSLLSAPAAASVRAAGLAPAGEVFGCLVTHLGWSGGFCGAYRVVGGTGAWGGGAPGWGGTAWTTPVVTSGDPGGSRNGFAPYVRAVEHAWNGALERMLIEARALGADGVVGVRAARSHLTGRVEEFTALGTAVRVVDPALAPGLAARDDVWSTGLSGQDCASAVLSGLVPRGLALGLSVATKHEDWQMRQQRSSFSNAEVTGLTTLVQTARGDARRRLAAHAGRFGGGDLVITGMSLRSFDTPCGEEQDAHAEALFTGSVLTAAPGGPVPGARTAVLPVLPLTDATSRTTSRSPYRNRHLT